MINKKYIIALAAAAATGSAQAAVSVVGVSTTGVAGEQASGTSNAYGADASSTDLINGLTAAYSTAPFAGASTTAINDGAVGAESTLTDITFWLAAAAGDTFTVTFTLDTSVNTLGYDINSIQSIHGWHENSGFQKAQNYVVETSSVGSAAFTNLATVAYFGAGDVLNTDASTNASTKVNITEDATGVLATGVDQIRFIYTVPTGGTAANQASPTIREVDVIGAATVPEPSSTALLGLGGLALLMRRKK